MISFEVMILLVPLLLMFVGIVFCASVFFGVVFWILNLPIWIPATLFTLCIILGVHCGKTRLHQHPRTKLKTTTKPSVYDFTLPDGFYIDSVVRSDFKK